MSSAKKDAVSRAIEGVVRESIQSADVVAILTERTKDSDGDDIILVNVIFDNKTKTLNAREISRLTRSVRQKLIELDERRFPSFSYIAKSEAGKLAAA